MQKYCTNCGARIIGDIKFCDRCGEPRKPDISKRPPAPAGDVIKRKKSSGIWKFFAGTAVGAFFMHFFGGSASASSSSSNSTHTETIENYHDTVVYAREREYIADDEYYEDEVDEVDEEFVDEGEEYEDDDVDDDVSDDDYDDSYDDGYDDDE